MPKEPKIQSNEEMEAVKEESAPIKQEAPQLKLLTASQAFNTLGGNVRLKAYIEKKMKGAKSLEDWRSEFKSKELI